MLQYKTCNYLLEMKLFFNVDKYKPGRYLILYQEEEFHALVPNLMQKVGGFFDN